MGVAGLIEAVASISIAAVVFATLTGALGTTAVTSIAAWGLVHEMSEQRHIEHLLETTLARARAAGGGVVECTESDVVVEADLDANGAIDASSSERTAFSIVDRSGGVRALTQRLGGQSITVTDRLGAADVIGCRDAGGAPAASPDLVRVVEVPVARESTRTLAWGPGG